MRTIYSKMLFILFLVPIMGFAGNEFNGRYTKEKKITKQYNVSPNALLRVSNSYGNVDVTTWNQNRIEIEVIIKTNGNDEEKVIEKLREIDVEFNSSSSLVSAKTHVERQDRSWWSEIFGSSSNVSMEINYTIKAPVKNSVDLSNDYGNIRLDRLEGNASINCDYGRIIIGDLMGENNSLNFDYTRNSTINYMKRGKINADYSEYTIDEAGTLEISADYTDSRIGKVEHILFNCDYGGVYIEKLRNLKGQGDYVGIKIGSVYNTLNLEMDYGSLTIEQLMNGIQKIDIETDYTSVKIGYDRNTAFNFQINTSYGGVKGIDGNSNFQVNKRRQSGSDNFYEGYHLSGTSGGHVNVNASYGSVTFTN